jgi:ABC-type transport system involved in multi-copper enzyme maturation permease subunit
MFEHLLTIGRNTFVEAIRQPIFTVLLIATGLMFVLVPALSAYTFDNDDMMLLEVGLSTLFASTVLMAAFTATGVVSEEIDNRTVLTVVSKPVSRIVFVAGKFLGITAALALAYWTLGAIFLLTLRHRVMSTAADQFDQPVLLFGVTAALVAFAIATVGNYLYRWVFTSTFVVTLAVGMTVAWLLVLGVDPQWQLQSPLLAYAEHETSLAQTLVAMLMIFECVLILTSVAVAVSTRLGQLMTLVICSGVAFLGLLTENFRLAGPADLADSPTPGLAAYVGYGLTQAVYLLTPKLVLLWPVDALLQKHDITLGYVAISSAQAMLYVLAALGLAVALFQRRDVG